MQTERLLELSELTSEIALKASEEVMDIYQRSEVSSVRKSDGSPVTEADISSHKIITEGLTKLALDIPILSEEDATKRKLEHKIFWLIDPLDGTKEFLNRNGEFTVNIALIDEGSPRLGIVSAPATFELYKGIKELGAFKVQDGVQEEIKTRAINKGSVTVTVSRSHKTEKDKIFLNNLSKTFEDIKLIEAGSSLKLCKVAEGAADIYCRMGPTYQWDIAAGHAVAESAGGALKALSGKNFHYLYDSELKNPEFYCVGDTRYSWQDLFT
tara:strand:+ start:15344 stop:16150 length:807 start_codon:yes stop_codon:yes gene_type:complete